MSETLRPVNPASFLDFVFLGNSDSGLTNIWSVQTALAPLGRVQWYAPWRRYWFVPLEGTGFDAACLKEIFEFCTSQTLRHANQLLLDKRRNETGIHGS